MTPSIDVVVVVYGRYELTASCLRHLQAQTEPHQVIVIDNHSPDDTLRQLASQWPSARLVCLPENYGFAAACNRGVSCGDGEIVVLLNNDVDSRPDFLQRLAAPLVQDPRLGSAAALMLQPGERLIDSAGLAADATLAAYPRLQGWNIEQARRERPVLAGPAGTAAAYRRAAWEQAGGLDDSIFSYMEDLDLALRLRAAGWGTALAADAVGVHLGSATHGNRSARQRRYGGFARGYMLRRYGLLRGRVAARALATEAAVVLGDLAISHDLAALRGRVSGWHAGRSAPRVGYPPAEAIDQGIGFFDSLALRRGVYERRAA